MQNLRRLSRSASFLKEFFFRVFSFRLLHGHQKNNFRRVFHVFLTSKMTRIFNEIKINSNVMEVLFWVAFHEAVEKKPHAIKATAAKWSSESKFIAPDSVEMRPCESEENSNVFSVNYNDRTNFHFKSLGGVTWEKFSFQRCHESLNTPLELSSIKDNYISRHFFSFMRSVRIITAR